MFQLNLLLIRYLIVILILISSTLSFGQVYRGIDEIKPYKKQLAELDMYLQLDPKQCKKIYDDLFSISLKKKDKTLQCVLYIYKGSMHYYMSKKDSAVVYFDKAIALSEKLKNNQLHSTSKIRKLFVIDGNSDKEIMFKLMKDEFEIAESNRDTINMIYSLNGMALYTESQDKTKESVALYVEAIDLAKKNNNEFEYGFLLNNLGLLKLRLKAHDEALKDFNKGLKIAEKLNNTRLELTLRENIGYYYMEIDSHDLAEKEWNESFIRANKLNYNYISYNATVNLGVLARTRGDNVKADSLMQEALRMAKEGELYYGISPIFLNLAQIELFNGHFNKVIPYLDSAIAYAKYTSPNDVQEGVYQITYRLHEKKGNYKKALEVYKEMSNFRDSVDKNGQMQIITELQLKYDVEKKEKQRVEENIAYEKELAHQELQTANLKQKVTLGIVATILLLGGFIIYYFKEKHKRESQFSSALVNKLEEERGRIARDLHDGLGQSLVILKNKFNKLETDPNTTSENINENFTKTIEEVRSISRSLIPPELRRLGLLKSINKMLKDIESSTGIVVTSAFDGLDELHLDSSQEIRIYRIIQELTNNTIKHSGGTSLKLEFFKTDSGFKLVYQDNGKGFEIEKAKTSEKSIGLKSIDQRLRYLNGTIKYEKQNSGVKAIVKIRIKK